MITFREMLTRKILAEEDPARGVDPPPFKSVYQSEHLTPSSNVTTMILCERIYCDHIEEALHGRLECRNPGSQGEPE